MHGRGDASTLMRQASCELVYRDFEFVAESVAFFKHNFSEIVGSYAIPSEALNLGGSLDLRESFALADSDEASAAQLIGNADGKLEMGECVVQESPSVSWHTSRVGPFRSTGGYDFWMLSHRGYRTVERLLDGRLPGERLGITAHVTGPVSSDGKFIGLPPLHNHHTHIAADKGLGWETLGPTALVNCFLRGEYCFNGISLVQHHGDYQNKAADGGTESFGQQYGPYAKMFEDPLRITMMVNDVRPSASTPLVWWFQTAFRVQLINSTTEHEHMPVAIHSALQSFATTLPSGLINQFTTVEVPMDQDSVVYYTGRMPFGGELVSVDWHAHMLVTQGGLFAATSPDQLGLTAARQEAKTKHTYDPIITSMTGYADNRAFLQYMMDELNRTERSLDAVVCRFEGNMEEVTLTSPTGAAHPVKFDRIATSVCLRDWKFAAGEQFTAVGFCGPLPSPAADKASNTDMGVVIGKTYPNHLSVFFYFVSEDWKSHSTVQFYSQQLDAVDIVLSRRDLIRSGWMGGSPASPLTLFEDVGIAITVSMLFIADAFSRVPLTASVVAIALMGGVCALLLLAPPHATCLVFPLLMAEIVYDVLVIVFLVCVPFNVYNTGAARSDAEQLAASHTIFDVFIKAQMLMLALLLRATTHFAYVWKQHQDQQAPVGTKAMQLV